MLDSEVHDVMVGEFARSIGKFFEPMGSRRTTCSAWMTPSCWHPMYDLYLPIKTVVHGEVNDTDHLPVSDIDQVVVVLYFGYIDQISYIRHAGRDTPSRRS